jgi:5-methylcytosine-specific restriction endonuclease McrA
VYEKILPGVWSLKSYFDLIEYKVVDDRQRKVFRYILRLSDRAAVEAQKTEDPAHTRLIPSEIKKEVWKRDNGRCVICGGTENLHFDHDLPFSKGGTSISAKNVRLLCTSRKLPELNDFVLSNLERVEIIRCF